MSFAALDDAANRLRILLETTTGRPLIKSLSLDAPKDDGSEFSFHVSVLWCYSLWFEACQPAGRHLLNMVRSQAPNDHKELGSTFNTVQNLRTAKAHNLDPAVQSDEKKLAMASIWIAAHGGSDNNWALCSTTLHTAVTRAVEKLYNQWSVVVHSSEDSTVAVAALLDAIDREWPGHAFDNLVSQAAASLGLNDFDVVSFRIKRLAAWRDITGLFSERQSAEMAVGRAIYQELRQIFGEDCNI